MDRTMKKYNLNIEIDQGFTCTGQHMVCEFTIDVGFTDEEVATIRQLVADAGAGKEDNLMPILERDAPDLYKRIDNDARKGMVDYFLEEWIYEYNDIELDEDEQRENFKKDLASGLFDPEGFIWESIGYSEVPEDEQGLFYLWSEWERKKLREEGAAWICSRYTVDKILDVSEEEYVCYIPKEWLGVKN